MVTCQSANQLKTPAKVSWAFKMVSQFGSLGYTIMGKTADLTVVQKTIIDTLHKGNHKHSLPKKLAVHRVLYPSMLTESWVEAKSVEEKDAQPTERTSAIWGLSSKIYSRIGWTSQGMDWGWGQGIKSHLIGVFLLNVSQIELNYWNKLTFPRHSNLRCSCISENTNESQQNSN